MRRFQILFFAVPLFSLLFCSASFGQLAPTEVGNVLSSSRPVVIKNAGLGRGVNFGNMLEAPSEGEWGLFVEEIFFDKVVEAGMDHVRIPISWTHHTSDFAPFQIDPEFFDRVDTVIDFALQRGLRVIVNVHHYDELNADPQGEQERALAIWQQIATRYQNLPATVFFEILNEPHGQFNDEPDLWNQFMVEALDVIRQTNPTRKVLVGPVFYNSISELGSFAPPNDDNLVTTVHYYEPFPFTHQGAEWINPVPPVGVTWTGEAFGLNGGWQNWSWNSDVESTNSALAVTYNEGYAGFQVHNPNLVSGATELRFTIDQPLNLNISVRDLFNDVEQFYSLTTSSGTQTYVVDISDYGASNQISNIFIQNNSPNPQNTFNISNFELVTNDSVISVINSEADRIAEAFRTAFQWGLDNHMPMHLGEFGAYNPADMDSRVRWTEAVRENAEQFRLDWAYWELAAGFGFYDPDNNSFRLPLLQALVPDFQ